jgi:segregation and condensation protein B
MRQATNHPKSSGFHPFGGRNHRGRTQYWFFNHILKNEGITREAYVEDVEEVDDVEKRRRLEAVLFLTPEGISSRKAAKLAGLADATEARTLIRQLNLDYDQHGRPYRVEEVAGGFALLTRSNFAPWLRRLSYMPSEVRLGQSAVETLAIVAYRQPVLRANIESIRGVGCNEVLKYLMELDLVRICGRSEDLGRPYLYGTTRRFLQMFGLRSADRLPRIVWVNDLDSDSNEISGTMSSQQIAGLDSEAKESTMKMSFSATALLESGALPNIGTLPDQSILLEQQVRPASAVDDDEDDFEDDEFEDDDEDDDDEEWDDDDDEVADVEDDDADEVAADEDESEDVVEADDTEDSEWEEVDDDGEEDWDDDDDDEDDDDDWDEDDDEDEEEDWD